MAKDPRITGVVSVSPSSEKPWIEPSPKETPISTELFPELLVLPSPPGWSAAGLEHPYRMPSPINPSKKQRWQKRSREMRDMVRRGFEGFKDVWTVICEQQTVEC